MKRVTTIHPTWSAMISGVGLTEMKETDTERDRETERQRMKEGEEEEWRRGNERE